MKLIGVTPRILVEDGVQKQFVNTRYVKPLHERQLNTIMLTMDNPNLEAILARLLHLLCDNLNLHIISCNKHKIFIYIRPFLLKKGLFIFFIILLYVMR